MEANERVVLIDGKNFVFRNHFTHQGLSTEDGEPTGVLFGCLNGLLSLAKRLPGTPIVFVWDGGGETWRHRLLRPDGKPATQQSAPKKEENVKPVSWAESRIQSSLSFIAGARKSPEKRIQAAQMKAKPQGYKAHRFEAKGADERMVAINQIPELIRVMKMIGIRNFKIYGLEGDDLIGILALEALRYDIFKEVIIHSTDRDFCQLLNIEGISILHGLSDGNMNFKNERHVMEEEGVAIDEWVNYRAITGDKSDNIPQLLRGVGPVTARKWLRAGLDVTKYSSHVQIPEKAKNMVNDFTRGGVNWEDFWRRAQKNKLACRIVCDADYTMLSKDVLEELDRMVGRNSSFSQKSFLRRESGMTEDSYRSFLEWLSAKEMVELRSRIGEFRQLK